MSFLYIFRNHQRGVYLDRAHGGGGPEAGYRSTPSMECPFDILRTIPYFGNTWYNYSKE
jgi:hypothetical protein